mgnify:CR=1 FL=1
MITQILLRVSEKDGHPYKAELNSGENPGRLDITPSAAVQ